MLPPSTGSEEVSRELQKLLDTHEFRRNRNASAFLKFVVEETLAGRGDRLKAFTIATLALQRDDTFDPQNNSIVRVQATRVRQMLETYYGGPGLDDPVCITLPRGSYMPNFQSGVGESGAEITGRRRWPRRHLVTACAVACLAAGGILGVLMDRHLIADRLASIAGSEAAPDPRRGPLLLVTVDSKLQTGPESKAFLGSLVSLIRSGLGAFDHLVISHSDSPASKPDYVLSVADFGRSERGENLAFNLVHRASDAIIWTSSLDGISLRDPATSLQAVARRVVPAVGDVSGALFTDWARRVTVPGELPSGKACIFAVFQLLKGGGAADRTRAIACLEKDSLANPDDPITMSALAIVLLRGYANGWAESRGVADLQRALQLARRSYDLAPYRARSQFTLFQARFYDGRYDDAFALGTQALTSNPYSSNIRATLGAAMVARGQFVDGLAQLREAYAQDSALPLTFGVFMAIGSLMTGDLTQFQQWAMRTSAFTTPVGICVRMLALDRQGDLDALRAAWERLEQDDPGFAADPAAALTRNGFTPDLRDLLTKVIDKARASREVTP